MHDRKIKESLHANGRAKNSFSKSKLIRKLRKKTLKMLLVHVIVNPITHFDALKFVDTAQNTISKTNVPRKCRQRLRLCFRRNVRPLSVIYSAGCGKKTRHAPPPPVPSYTLYQTINWRPLPRLPFGSF